MYQTAEDEAERARIHAKLYTAPKGTPPPRRQGPRAGGVARAEAEALMARLEAEDAALRGAR
ncbi:hypothetical protein [Streptomyces sp. NPDC007346]|uniref:hypothetical protein n=1 Tax=Streptomyces sp. NPDC007346 TaxID=3154682 RepID=UPI00345588D9